MFRIEITDKQKREIEKIFWEWIKRRLTRFKNKLKCDKTFCKSCGIDPDKDNSIKNFLLSDTETLRNYLNVQASITLSDYILGRYDAFRKDTAADIIRVLNISSCPYCNQYDIPVIRIADDKYKFMGELDHFYNKEKYPHLALCLYNLIPSCKICNHEKHNRSSDDMQNPYSEEYMPASIRFRTDFDDAHDISYLEGNSDRFRIVTEIKNSRDRAEDETFRLHERYELLKVNAREIIIKARIYDRIYIDVLKEFPGMNESEIRAFIFGYRDNHNQRSLSKFNSDITDEFISA